MRTDSCPAWSKWSFATQLGQRVTRSVHSPFFLARTVTVRAKTAPVEDAECSSSLGPAASPCQQWPEKADKTLGTLCRGGVVIERPNRHRPWVALSGQPIERAACRAAHAKPFSVESGLRLVLDERQSLLPSPVCLGLHSNLGRR